MIREATTVCKKYGMIHCVTAVVVDDDDDDDNDNDNDDDDDDDGEEEGEEEEVYSRHLKVNKEQ